MVSFKISLGMIWLGNQSSRRGLFNGSIFFTNSTILFWWITINRSQAIITILHNYSSQFRYIEFTISYHYDFVKSSSLLSITGMSSAKYSCKSILYQNRVKQHKLLYQESIFHESVKSNLWLFKKLVIFFLILEYD